MDIEIRVYTSEGKNIQSLGKFKPGDVEAVLDLLRKYATEDKDGGIDRVDNIRFDVGVSPHIAVFCAEDNSDAEEEKVEAPF